MLFAKALAKISTGHASVHKLFLKMASTKFNAPPIRLPMASRLPFACRLPPVHLLMAFRPRSLKVATRAQSIALDDRHHSRNEPCFSGMAHAGRRTHAAAPLATSSDPSPHDYISPIALTPLVWCSRGCAQDKNESGQVSIDEFRTMCREDLKLTPERGLPDEKLWSLWRALDQNENGFICAGEWGRFMRTHAAALPADLNTEQSGKVREAHEADRARKQKEWAELASRKANELASAMEEEASRLEALLAKASARLLKPGAALANSRSAPQMEPIRRRATPASAGASTAHDGDGEIDGPSGADIAPEDGKGGTADGGQRRPGSLSPQKSAKELKKLSFQIAQGGGTRKRTGAPGKAKASELPMLRSFAIEEGLL